MFKNQARFPIFVGLPVAAPSHLSREGQPALIQFSISSRRHLTLRPSRTEAGLLPLATSVYQVETPRPHIAADSLASIRRLSVSIVVISLFPLRLRFPVRANDKATIPAINILAPLVQNPIQLFAQPLPPGIAVRLHPFGFMFACRTIFHKNPFSSFNSGKMYPLVIRLRWRGRKGYSRACCSMPVRLSPSFACTVIAGAIVAILKPSRQGTQ